MEDQAEVDAWFEREMPNAATHAAVQARCEYQMAMSFGYAELTPDGHHFNTCILTDRSAKIVGKYRKVHLPGHSEFDTERAFQHLEKRYFEPGDTGFQVWRTMGGIFGMAICNDRRWPETYRVMGLQGVEMILLGYNTPSVNSQKARRGLRSGCSTIACRCSPALIRTRPGSWPSPRPASRTASRLIGGSLIVDPNGEIVAEATTEDDELLVPPCDLDATIFGKKTIFDFARHRRIEHYGPITSQTGAVPPPEL